MYKHNYILYSHAESYRTANINRKMSHHILFLDKEDWSQTFEITKEPYLQSLQYKILNRILNNKQNMYKWKLSQTYKCNVCSEVDSLSFIVQM